MTICDFLIVVAIVFVLGICGGVVIDIVATLTESANDENVIE